MKRITLFAAAFLFAVGIIGCISDSGEVGAPVTQVQIDSGTLVGKVLDSGVKAWLGIPFAKPPVRELRWREPQPITWEGVSGGIGQGILQE